MRQRRQVLPAQLKQLGSGQVHPDEGRQTSCVVVVMLVVVGAAVVKLFVSTQRRPNVPVPSPVWSDGHCAMHVPLWRNREPKHRLHVVLGAVSAQAKQ